MDYGFGKNFSGELAAAMRSLMKTLLSLMKEEPLAIERVVKLYDGSAQKAWVAERLLNIVPKGADTDQWLSWLEGGRAPTPRIVLQDPDRGKKTSARGAYLSAASRVASKTREVVTLREKLAEGEEELKQFEAVANEADAHLRATVAYRMLTEESRMTAGVFAMGPMWTIVRAVSAEAPRDLAYEDTLDPADRINLDTHYETRAQTSRAIQELLDAYAGDLSLNVKLHDALHAVLVEHHAPVVQELEQHKINNKPLSGAAKRVRRSVEQRRDSLRSGAPRADRYDVLRGLSPEVGDPDDPVEG